MIRIFTSWDLCPKTDKVITSSDVEFMAVYSSMKTALLDRQELLNKFCEVIKAVDDVTILGLQSDCISTRYGVANIEHLSTGCKTALLVLYYNFRHKSLAINVTECGPNALFQIFRLVDESNCLILQHPYIPNKIEGDFSVNSEVFHITGSQGFIARLKMIDTLITLNS